MTKLHANGTDAAREPAINKGLGDDVYLAPMPGKENNRLEILPSITEESSQPIMTSVSVKPCIWLLWLGSVLVCGGSLLALRY